MSETINQRIKELRLFCKKEQTEFAESIGIKQGSLSDIERGKVTKISDSIIILLKIIYKANEDWLKTGSGEMIINTQPEEECECCKQKQKEIDNLNFLIERYEKILGLKDLEEGKKSTSESFTGKNIAS